MSRRSPKARRGSPRPKAKPTSQPTSQPNSQPKPAPSVQGLSGQGLTKRFGDRTIVSTVDLEVKPGEVLALVGSNGTGKTTLLRMLAGALDPDEGTVTWLGRTIDESDAWIRAQLAVLLDDAGTFADLAVSEHLELMARAFGLDDPVGRAGRVLDEVGLAGRGAQLPATLSSGQRHRLGLAAVLVRPAGLLVLDEPEQRLDAPGRAWLAERLRSLADDGAAVVLASHDSGLVEAVSDLVLTLE